MLSVTVFNTKGTRYDGSVSAVTKSFLKIKEAVQYFGIGKEVFYRAIHSGELKAYIPNGRDFLLKVVEVEKWIESKRLLA